METIERIFFFFFATLFCACLFSVFYGFIRAWFLSSLICVSVLFVGCNNEVFAPQPLNVETTKLSEEATLKRLEAQDALVIAKEKLELTDAHESRVITFLLIAGGVCDLVSAAAVGAAIYFKPCPTIPLAAIAGALSIGAFSSTALVWTVWLQLAAGAIILSAFGVSLWLAIHFIQEGKFSQSAENALEDFSLNAQNLSRCLPETVAFFESYRNNNNQFPLQQ